ncbi:MAG TPA: hypothetical protein VEA77_01105 [Hyphomicrobium sp.]|jgi:hypothetical protein|nr:hypothetical protein [Hyphomicrobium sp.]
MPDNLKKDLDKIRKKKTVKSPPENSERKRESTVSMPEQPTEGPTTADMPADQDR